MELVLLLFGLLQLCNLPTMGQDVRVYQFEITSNQRVQAPQTPCPQIFRYQYGNNGWTGMVSIPPPNTEASLRSVIPIKLEVYLRVNGHLPSKYIGRLDLAESKESALQKVLQGDSSRGLIQYRLQFPTVNNLPVLLMVKLNGNSICTGNPNSFSSYGQVTTSIVLDHTFYPTANALSVATILNNNKNSEVQTVNGGNFGRPVGSGNSENTHIYETNEGFPSVTSTNSNGGQPFIQGIKPAQRPQTIQGSQISQFSQTNQGSQINNRPQHFQEPQVIQKPQLQSSTERNPPSTLFQQIFLEGQDSRCGKPVVGNQLVAHGKEIKKGSWPWLVALFKKIAGASGVKFICGGTLINEDYVITAAHCVVEKNTRLNPEQLLLYLGKFNLGSWTEAGIQPRDVKNIHVHQDYKGSDGSDADVALLKLNEKAVYSQFVRPACLWPFKANHHKDYTDLKILVGRKGTVVGWGKDEHGMTTTNEPKYVTVPVVSQRECFDSHSDLRHFTTNRTLCAGAQDGSGPCNGDSGGGLMFLMNDNNNARWFLRGIVSLSLSTADRNCDLQNYIVYTDLAKFGGWLSGFIEGTKGGSPGGNRLSSTDGEMNPDWETIPFSSL